MNRRLRSPDMEQTFSFTTVAGTTHYACHRASASCASLHR
jgi:hypothetical protein